MIDPYPSEIVRTGFPGLSSLHLREIPVQDVPLDLFLELGAQDVLFIDSSHVAKTGSDVQFLTARVLPSLQRGAQHTPSSGWSNNDGTGTSSMSSRRCWLGLPGTRSFSRHAMRCGLCHPRSRALSGAPWRPDKACGSESGEPGSAVPGRQVSTEPLAESDIVIGEVVD